MVSVKRFLYSLIQFKKKYFQKIILFYNYYCANCTAIRNKRVLLIKHAPKCNQFTKITGSGKLEIGNNCVFGYKPGGHHRGGYIELQPRYNDARIIIGDNVLTNNNLFVCAANFISIGSDTLIGENVTIMDHEAHGVLPNERRKIGEIGKVQIGKNVWVGNNVTILKNTEIGNNTIVATGAVVSGKFPSDVIIGGIPAKIIKQLDINE
ncbi:MAG: dapH 2 [Ferruginibacter sp.]|nr:dapH 2 [Ferruginibacter sp.]